MSGPAAFVSVPVGIKVTVEGQPPYDFDKFLRALGLMTLRWADAEHAMYNVLIYYSEVPYGVSNSLFSGTRATDAMKFINSIAHNTAMAASRKDDLEFVFAQMSTIGTVRNFIVHHASETRTSVDPITGKRTVSDKDRITRKENAKTMGITPEDLDNISDDLRAIEARLWRHVEEHDRRAPFTAEPQQPWLYRFPAPANAAGTSPTKPRKQPRQPPPSQP